MRGVPNIQIFADVQFDDSNGDDVWCTTGIVFSPAGTHPDATCKTLVRLTHINSWWYHEAGAQPADTLATLATVLHRLKACQAVLKGNLEI